MKVIFTAVFAFLFFAAPLYGDFELEIASGYGVGSLNIEGTQTSATMAPFRISNSYNFRFRSKKSLGLGLSFNTSAISFNLKQDKYSGVNTYLGPKISYTPVLFKKGYLVTEFEYHPLASIIAVSNSEVTVNEESYKTSTLLTLTGQQSYEFRFGYGFLFLGKPKSRSDRGVFSLKASYLGQTFTEKEVKVATSNSTLAPSSVNESGVSYTSSFFIFSLSFQYIL